MFHHEAVFLSDLRSFPHNRQAGDNTIALIMKVKGSAFLFAVCIKKSGIQIQDNSLWHLNTVNFLPKHFANRKKLI